MAERGFGFDADPGFVWIGKFGEPRFVERRHDFGGEDGVDADAVGKKFDGPFAS